jgi:hypothetical protein
MGLHVTLPVALPLDVISTALLPLLLLLLLLELRLSSRSR